MDCNLGSEIGQKMRSAVKAKLMELGTGGNAGFIDDELPDYVMVMVANKRTKQQMNAELNLFLGEQTDLFVTWLHEVLQKLQEVTLPTSSASKKRKSRQSETSKTKDKKGLKKDKDKKGRRSGEDAHLSTAEPSSTTAESVPVISSITDVFAKDILEKAKTNLEEDTGLKYELLEKKKKRKSGDDQPQEVATTDELPTQDFDIPTMSEISLSTTTTTTKEVGGGVGGSSGNREKDLAELAEIQKKIYAAKQHLRKIGELDDNDDIDEDDDFLNLNEQDEPAVNELDQGPKTPQPVAVPRKAKSPIVFTRRSKTPEQSQPQPPPPPPPVERAREQHVTTSKQNESKQRDAEERTERRSVHDRLGSRAQGPPERQQQQQRTQKELYVPAHRRRDEPDGDRSKETNQQRDRGKDINQRDRVGHRDRSRETRTSRDRERRDSSRDLRDRSRRSPRDERRGRRSRSTEVVSTSPPKQRIGSRVIVATNKPPEPSDDEDLVDKPVYSVITVKPRPHVSPGNQVSNKLLLRAVAEAQRSTILVKPTTAARKESEELELISTTLGKRKSNDKSSTGGITSRLSRDQQTRERTKRRPVSGELFRRTTHDLVVNVLQREAKRSRRSGAEIKETEIPVTHQENDDEDGEEEEEADEEYVPALNLTDYETYVPQIVPDGEDIDMHVEANENISQSSSNGLKTQFVVTLNGDTSLDAYRRRSSGSRKHSQSPATPQVSSSAAVAAASNSELTSSSSRSRTRKAAVSTTATTTTTKAILDRNSTHSHSPSSSNTPPPLVSRSMHRSEVLRQTQEIKKIIINNNDTDEDDDASKVSSNKKLTVRKRHSSVVEDNTQQAAAASSSNGYKKKDDKKPRGKGDEEEEEERSTTPPLPPKKTTEINTNTVASSEKSAATSETAAPLQPAKSKHTPIRFTLKSDIEEPAPSKKRRSNSHERHSYGRESSVERRKISIRNAEDRKYDNLPALSAVSVDSTVMKVVKPKERCKYHPNCTKQFCDFYHPTAPCKSFPNCKFADKCMYSHPKCKFDTLCMSIDCNFAHSGSRDFSHVQLTAPPLSSHVIPVQNYKSISAPVTTTTATTMCKFYPNCSKVGCTFYHPKPCRYGKNCINKLECIFYHPEVQSKFKWVASLG